MTKSRLKKISGEITHSLDHLASAAFISQPVEQQEIMLHLVQACPSFSRPMKRFIRRTNTKLVYVLLGEFARHVLKLYKQGDMSELPAVADAVEHLYIHGTDYVKKAVSGGLLEVIQIHCRHDNIDPEPFAEYLKPVSIRFWQYLHQCQDEE